MKNTYLFLLSMLIMSCAATIESGSQDSSRVNSKKEHLDSTRGCGRMQQL